MTRAFQRFLRAFSDDELAAFARERAAVHPPYWTVMHVALRIEAGRRGLRLDDDLPASAQHEPAIEDARTGTA